MSEARDQHPYKPDDASDSPAVARQRCLDFATMHSEVPIYARIVAGMADDDDAIALLCSAAPGQARPVLLLAALHELTMLQPDTPAAQWFSPDATLDRGDLWPDVRRTIDAHRDELRTVVAGRSTQTNEVNRATYVRAMVSRAAADLPETPVTIVELGASAGFLLGFDDYRVTVGEVTVARTAPGCGARPRTAARRSTSTFPRSPHASASMLIRSAPTTPTTCAGCAPASGRRCPVASSVSTPRSSTCAATRPSWCVPTWSTVSPR